MNAEQFIKEVQDAIRRHAKAVIYDKELVEAELKIIYDNYYGKLNKKTSELENKISELEENIEEMRYELKEER